MWIETTQNVYSALYSYFKKELVVHSSITDIDGTSPFGNGKPTYQTDWGREDKKYPALRHIDSKETAEQVDWEGKFFIYYPEPEDLNPQV